MIGRLIDHPPQSKYKTAGDADRLAPFDPLQPSISFNLFLFQTILYS